MLSYEDIVSTGGNKDEASASQAQGPYKELYEEDFKRGLIDKIASLPERERLVMSLYYEEEFNLREIGEILGVSEGRVCQIHGQALVRLRARMSEWVDENS